MPDIPDIKNEGFVEKLQFRVVFWLDPRQYVAYQAIEGIGEEVGGQKPFKHPNDPMPSDLTIGSMK
jgi:hypothetical protein